MPGEYTPIKKRPENDIEYFETITRAVFQAGFSYKVIDDKWDGFRKVFDNFDPEIVAKWDDVDIADALESKEIVRNERKILATVDNAKTFNSIVEDYGSFSNYMDELRPRTYEEIKKTLSDRFKWLGKTGVYYLLYSTDEDVPEWEKR